MPGTSSRNNSSRFAASAVVDIVKPVTLRLGCDMLLLNPRAIGSPTTIMTIGISRVAFARTTATVEVEPTIWFLRYELER